MARHGKALEKALGATGRWSRSQAGAIIKEGRVNLNGETCRKPGVRVDAHTDKIAVDGELVLLGAAEPRLFRFHKPVGLITTDSDPQGRPTVFSALPQGLPRLMTVGRLDMKTEGLLMLTTSGPLARMLELPSSGMERQYRAQLATGSERSVTAEMIAELARGLTLNDGTSFRPITAMVEDREGGGRGSAWVRMTLVEGKKHEVRPTRTPDTRPPAHHRSHAARPPWHCASQVQPHPSG